MNLSDWYTVWWWAAAGSGALYILLIFWFMIGWIKLKRPNHVPLAATPMVTIIIPVRNEEFGIEACIQSILQQDYPAHRFEIIAINDYSIDGSLRLLKGIQDERLRVLDLVQYFGEANERIPNKKRAITLGVKNAKGDVIITTDGDCTFSTKWLSAMIRGYQQEDCKLLTAPVLPAPARGFFALFQQTDVMTLSGITGATLATGTPVMCNGANLLYEKKTFLEVDGFKGNLDTPTGDDIFLMQKIQQRFPGSIRYLKDYDACALTKTEPTLSGFFSQRIRWSSKSTRFASFSTRLILLFAWCYQLAIISTTFACVLKPNQFALPLLVLLGSKLIMDALFGVVVAHFFQRKRVLLLLPLYELVYIFYVLLTGVFALRGRYRWKHRNV
ncbi:MAG: glycosyltransferase [Chitinophagales bacterium]